MILPRVDNDALDLELRPLAIISELDLHTCTKETVINQIIKRRPETSSPSGAHTFSPIRCSHLDLAVLVRRNHQVDEVGRRVALLPERLDGDRWAAPAA